jgi:hypothetical protein
MPGNTTCHRRRLSPGSRSLRGVPPFPGFSIFVFGKKDVNTKNSKNQRKGESMRLNMNHVPDVVKLEYLRGRCDGMIEVLDEIQYDDLLAQRIDEMVNDLKAEIADIEGRAS